MLHGRWCPQTSAGVWHRARPQQRPEAHDGGALATKQVICGKMCRVLFYMLLIPPTGEESALDGAEQAAPPGVVHVDAAAPWRSEEAGGSISQAHKTRRFSGHCSLGPSSHIKLSFSVRFPVVSRSVSRGVFDVVLVVWCYAPSIFPQFHEMCFMFLLCRMFTSPHPLRRCVGKQKPAAPKVQLRDVVWSDESFFQLREQPNHQNIFGACPALPRIIFKPSVERRVRFWRILQRSMHGTMTRHRCD